MRSLVSPAEKVASESDIAFKSAGLYVPCCVGVVLEAMSCSKVGKLKVCCAKLKSN